MRAFVTARPPRAPALSTRWAVDALDGTVITLEHETHPRSMPDARVPRNWDRGLSADSSDLEASPATAHGVIALDDQLVLVIDDPDPWAHETEPVFWST